MLLFEVLNFLFEFGPLDWLVNAVCAEFPIIQIIMKLFKDYILMILKYYIINSLDIKLGLLFLIKVLKQAQSERQPKFIFWNILLNSKKFYWFIDYNKQKSKKCLMAKFLFTLFAVQQSSRFSLVAKPRTRAITMPTIFRIWCNMKLCPLILITQNS